MEHAVARGVAVGCAQVQAGLEFKIIFHHQGPARFHHRQHAVGKRAMVGRRLAFGQGLAVGFLPVAVFGLGKHIARVGKGGHPLPVLQARVPAHVVGMHVGATDKVNVFGRHPGLRQRLHKRELRPVPTRPVGSLFVVAHTSVDQNAVPPGLDQVAVKRHDGAVLFVDIVGLEPIGMGIDVGLRDAGQNVFQRSKRALVFGDPIDGELPQLLRLHVDALGYVAPMRPRFPHPLARKGQSIPVRV